MFLFVVEIFQFNCKSNNFFDYSDLDLEFPGKILSETTQVRSDE